VVTKLKAAKVQYQMGEGGRSVRVPAERVDELRMQIASTGLSAGHIGYEIFDRPAFGTTEFLEHVNFKRALEGEIARTISTLSEVQSARVSIAMAKDSLFVDQAQSAKASVTLKLKSPNRPLSQATVRGIASLVAGSVEQLRPESVSIIDTDGHFLSAPVDAEDTTANAGLQFDRQQQVERDLAMKVVSLLEPVAGAGRVRVNVSARLNADALEVTEVKVDPASVVVGRSTLTETNSLGNPMGVAGARANQPAGNSTSTNPANSATANPAATANSTPPANATPPNGNAANTPASAATPPVFTPPFNGGVSTVASGSNRQQDTTNYEIGKTTSHRISPQGQLARLSVAVILDNQRVPAPAAAPGAAAPATPPATRPWDEPGLTRIRNLVAAAVGLDETRGDKLTVENISFDAPSLQTGDPGAEPAGPTLIQQVKVYAPSALRTVGIIIVAWFAIFGVLRPMMRQASAAPAAPALNAPMAAAPSLKGPTVQEMEGQIEAELDAATGQRRKLPVLTKRVAKLASQEPEQLARIVRGWMAEGDR
jgi:flagellar M-ring protein FliF